jgi:hypothetical protein
MFFDVLFRFFEMEQVFLLRYDANPASWRGLLNGCQYNGIAL